MAIHQLQQRLQSIYEIETGHAVADFLVSDEAVKNLLTGGSSHLRETVFISELDEHLDITVYLHADIVTHLLDDNPEQGLHSGNVEDFCLATEGISHFLKLVWHGEYDRSVSLIELELQAEIDKFVLMHMYSSEQTSRVKSREIRKLLFDTVDFHADLHMQELERYQCANHYAGKYCRALERLYIHRDDSRNMLRELRRFYRLPLADKLRRINALN
jgi:hypothetical protein